MRKEYAAVIHLKLNEKMENVCGSLFFRTLELLKEIKSYKTTNYLGKRPLPNSIFNTNAYLDLSTFLNIFTPYTDLSQKENIAVMQLDRIKYAENWIDIL